MMRTWYARSDAAYISDSPHLLCYVIYPWRHNRAFYQSRHGHTVVQGPLFFFIIWLFLESQWVIKCPLFLRVFSHNFNKTKSNCQFPTMVDFSSGCNSPTLQPSAAPPPPGLIFYNQCDLASESLSSLIFSSAASTPHWAQYWPPQTKMCSSQDKTKQNTGEWGLDLYLKPISSNIVHFY